MSTNEASQHGVRVQSGGRAPRHDGRDNRRVGQRVAILAVVGAILTALIAWNALLVYAVARIVGVVT